MNVSVELLPIVIVIKCNHVNQNPCSLLHRILEKFLSYFFNYS